MTSACTNWLVYYQSSSLNQDTLLNILISLSFVLVNEYIFILYFYYVGFLGLQWAKFNKALVEGAAHLTAPQTWLHWKPSTVSLLDLEAGKLCCSSTGPADVKQFLISCVWRSEPHTMTQRNKMLEFLIFCCLSFNYFVFDVFFHVQPYLLSGKLDKSAVFRVHYK